MNINKNIGRDKFSQKIIDMGKSKKILETFNNLFLENQIEIKKYLKHSTKIQNKFWLEFFENKSFNMNIDPHIIKYVIN